MNQGLLIATLVGSYINVAVSACLFIFFLKHRKNDLGRAVAFMLFGEMVAGMVVACFATMELANVLRDLPVEIASALRWITISVTIFSSMHLARVVYKTIKG